MRFSVRIFLAYFALLGLALWVLMRSFSQELLPGMRQSLEETLVDTANLLAEVVGREMVAGNAGWDEFARAMQAYQRRPIEAQIWFLKKRDPNLIVYITDADGIVRYHSRGRDLGRDYSRWNDVYLTLRGRYGARTTRDDENNRLSGTMYVAAPILDHGRIVGVLSVGKSSVAIQPFLRAALDNIREKGVWLMLAALVPGALISFWLTRSIRRLTRYARAVREGRRAGKPRLRETELSQLADAMEAMRTELEGKDYVERYLHGLTHELKSPLAAIRGAVELLTEELPAAQRARFVANIASESQRLQQIVERLLSLAALEKRQRLERVDELELTGLLGELLDGRAALLQSRDLHLDYRPPGRIRAQGDGFLLHQAIGNLLDNAIEFSPAGGRIGIALTHDPTHWQLQIRDQGPGIPDYARDRLFQRFYSLPRPDSGRKSSGLGLSLVQEVVSLHGGRIAVDNHPEGGAVAHLSLPLRIPAPN